MKRISRMKMWLLVAFLFGPLFGHEAQAATINAASCSQTDVQAAVNSSKAGDTVVVPAGTCSWSGGISINGIILQGAGSSTSGTVITGGLVTISKNVSYHTRLTGFRFTGTDQHFVVNGADGVPEPEKAFIIDNNYFAASNTGSSLGQINVNGGVIYDNSFTSPSTGGSPGSDIFRVTMGVGSCTKEWGSSPTFGNQDTTGEQNIYFENNTFTDITETAPDTDDGTRLVFRYNTMNDSSLVFHAGGSGGSGNDTSLCGTRQFEIYNNTFNRVTGTINMNKWIWARGATGVIANNAMDGVSSSSYPSKTDIKLGVDCPNPYPLQYQVGQSNQTPENSPSHPLLIFGNTGSGPGGTAGHGDTYIGITQNGTGSPGGTCSNPTSYIQLNRDYYTSNQWNWTPYTYPHPLRQPSGTASVAPPSNLTAVVQ